MSTEVINEILSGLYENRVVPYLGPGVLFDATNKLTSTPIPADSNSLILAMNGGKPMAPKLMYEFPRAAMNQELKRGRNFITQFLNKIYKETEWTRASLHDWLVEWKPRYIIDINRDTQLQQSYSDEEHVLICGVARITETQYRYRIYHFDGQDYFEIPQEQVDPKLPILFKPMGTPLPDSNFIASDADYVDYITELMGGFAIPKFLKDYRKDKQYLLLGMPLNRDSERMVMSDIIYDAGKPKGWVLNKNPTSKEMRFCNRIGLEIIDMDVPEFLECVGYGKELKQSA
ncbi:MAG: SIR2 family protein [Gammaproteobacteria bacterium]